MTDRPLAPPVLERPPLAPLPWEPPGGTIGRLDGIPVLESAHVPWMRPILLMSSRTVIARELADVVARFDWDRVKADMRADTRAQLDAFAARVGVAR